jgi:hypothetical protein
VLDGDSPGSFITRLLLLGKLGRTGNTSSPENMKPQRLPMTAISDAHARRDMLSFVDMPFDEVNLGYAEPFLEVGTRRVCHRRTTLDRA